MKALVVLMTALLGSQASADGFVCENLEHNVRVKVYNHTQPQLGTRNAAKMIVSDPSIADGRKTIATFKDSDALLTNVGSVYTSKVDLRFLDSRRKGELLAGTKLGNVEFIVLDVDFSYAQPVVHESELAGELIIKRRSGADIRIDMQCERYLKGT